MPELNDRAKPATLKVSQTPAMVVKAPQPQANGQKTSQSGAAAWTVILGVIVGIARIATQAPKTTEPKPPAMPVANNPVPWMAPDAKRTQEQEEQFRALQEILNQSAQKNRPVIPQPAQPLDPNDPLVRAARDATRILQGDPSEAQSLTERDPKLRRIREIFNRQLNRKIGDPLTNRDAEHQELGALIASGMLGSERKQFREGLQKLQDELRDRNQLRQLRRIDPFNVPADAGIPENAGELRIDP